MLACTHQWIDRYHMRPHHTLLVYPGRGVGLWEGLTGESIRVQRIKDVGLIDCQLSCALRRRWLESRGESAHSM